MKRYQLLAAMLLATLWAAPLGSAATAETGPEKCGDCLLVYTFVVNTVPDRVDIPLIGFVNVARGDHRSAHLGFVNSTAGSFQGAKFGFVNVVGSEMTGLQSGFVNVSGGQGLGSQIGFVNVTKGSFQGVKVGFVNATSGPLTGANVGFVNTAETTTGPSIGFVNVTEQATGLQVGFVNAARTMHGNQIGFVNVADSVEDGLPIGLVSVVRRGGYRALEGGLMETSHLGVSFKIGVPRFYTSFIVAGQGDSLRRPALGFGFGTIAPLGERLYFNPEIQSLNITESDSRQISSLTPSVGFSIIPRLHLLAGPSLIWSQASGDQQPLAPRFSYKATSIDDQNDLLIGFRLALRVPFS